VIDLIFLEATSQTTLDATRGLKYQIFPLSGEQWKKIQYHWTIKVNGQVYDDE